MAKVAKQLRLNNLKNVKISLARLARECHGLPEPGPELSRYRTIGYLLGIYVQACRADNEDLLEQLEARIAAIEKAEIKSV